MPSPAKSSASAAKKAPSKEAAKTPEPTKPAAEAAKSTKATAAKTAVLTPAERMKMIAEAAYYLAEKRGFSGGNELTDWVAAEKQVDAILSRRG
jgi:hypothetical protein